MFDVGLIVLREVVVYYPARKWGGSWAGGRRRAGGGDARPIEPAQWVNPINNRDSIASAAYVTEAPPAIETIERRQQRKSAAKGMLFRGQDSRGVLLCSRAFLP